MMGGKSTEEKQRFIKTYWGYFPGGPEAKTPSLGLGSLPGQENWIPQAATKIQCSQIKLKKKNLLEIFSLRVSFLYSPNPNALHLPLVF